MISDFLTPQKFIRKDSSFLKVLCIVRCYISHHCCMFNSAGAENALQLFIFIFTEFVYVLHQKLFLQVNSIVSIHIIQSSLE